MALLNLFIMYIKRFSLYFIVGFEKGAKMHFADVIKLRFSINVALHASAL